MDKKKLWLIISCLVIMNIITLMIIMMKPGNREIVATIENQKISRQEWLDEMEARYGKTILQEMIDQQVIE